MENCITTFICKRRVSGTIRLAQGKKDTFLTKLQMQNVLHIILMLEYNIRLKPVHVYSNLVIENLKQQSRVSCLSVTH